VDVRLARQRLPYRHRVAAGDRVADE
jgi:hypothetical protein